MTAYEQGFRDYISKHAGIGSETVGALLNPINLLGGNIAGVAAAGVTPTRDIPDQLEADESLLANLLVPGMASYNKYKRVGAGNQIIKEHTPEASPYLNAILEATGSLPATMGLAYGAHKLAPDSTLAKGLALYGPGILGSVAAILSPARTDEEQSEYEQSVGRRLLNVIPGVGPYNFIHRLKHALYATGKNYSKTDDLIDRVKRQYADLSDDEKKAYKKKLKKVYPDLAKELKD